jgi:4-hydroxy-tetrahydrodipicolinate synthase
MTSTHPLAGVYAAAVTPLKNASTLDLESVPALADFLASRGCHGIVLFGTTGEGPSFSSKEREEVMRVLQVNRPAGSRLIAGTGTPSLTETIELTKRAFDLGYDAALVVPPYYFRKAGDDGLFEWFSEVIRKAVPADKFLIGYHIPPLIGIGFSIPLLEKLKNAFPSQFAGIKDSSHDVEFARAVGETFGSDLLVLNGTDSYLKIALEYHAAGCITAPANLISPDLREVWDLIRDGKDATAAQTRATEKRHILEKYPPFPPTLKALMHRMHGLPRWAVKPPLENLPEDKLESAFEEMQKE